MIIIYQVSGAQHLPLLTPKTRKPAENPFNKIINALSELEKKLLGENLSEHDLNLLFKLKHLMDKQKKSLSLKVPVYWYTRQG